MNKNIKKIIAIAMAVTAVSAFAPSGSYNLLTTKAYASDENTESLSKINLETSGGNTIKFYSDDDYDRDDRVEDDEVSDGGEYYAKTSSKRIKFDISGADKKYIKVFASSRSSIKDSAESKKISNTISLSSGNNTVVIKVYKEDVNSKTFDYDEDDEYNKVAEYTYHIKCTSSSSDDDDDDDDKIYLSDITLSDGEVDFSKKTSSYNVKVGSNVDEISIKAKPEDSDYDVHIDGKSVDEDDKWKTSVDLKKGKNKIEIKIEDDDDNKRTYTLNITRGNVEETSSSIYLDSLKLAGSDLTLSEGVRDYNFRVDNSADEVSIKAEPKDSDYTVTIDGEKVDSDDSYTKKVEVKDDVVNSYKVVVKNSSGTEQQYTINIAHKNVDASKFPAINKSSSTNTSSSTTTNNTNNTYVNTNANNWVAVNGNWRYYDDKGSLVTNTWVYDVKSGKEYYVNANGDMARGWLKLVNTWYYLGNDGSKKTGWQFDGSKWYYMDSTGKMLSNTTVGGYRLDASGAWVQ